ncbi:hypothetical protein PMAYCL1PPCAC_14307, partial [Pristionchus mayeri]
SAGSPEPADLTILSSVPYIHYFLGTWSVGVFNLYLYGLTGAYSLLLEEVRPRLERIWVLACLAVVLCSLSICFGLQYAMGEEYVDGGPVWTWLGIFSLHLYTLPLFLSFIRPPRPADVHRVPDGPFTFVLPFGAVVGVVFPPGSLMDTVARSSE